MLEDETNFDSKLPWVLFGILFEYVLVLEHPHSGFSPRADLRLFVHFTRLFTVHPSAPDAEAGEFSPCLGMFQFTLFRPLPLTLNSLTLAFWGLLQLYETSTTYTCPAIKQSNQSILGFITRPLPVCDAQVT